MEIDKSHCEEVSQTFQNSGHTVEIALAPLLSALNTIITGNFQSLRVLIDPEVKIRTMLGSGSSTAEYKKTQLIDSKLIGCMLHTSSRKKRKLFWPFSYSMFHVRLTCHFVVAHATTEHEAIRLQNIYELAFSNTIRNAEILAKQQISFSDALCCSSTSSTQSEPVKLSQVTSETNDELVIRDELEKDI